MSEADERFAKRLAEDLALGLRPGVVVLGVDIERGPDGAHLTARCAAGGERFEAESTAQNELEAYEHLRAAVVEERLRRAFVRLVDS